MAFEQFTQCIEPAKFVPRSYAVMAGQAAIIAGLGLPLAIGHPVCLIIVGEIFGLAFIIAYCRNWLYGRLICLGGDKAVIGAVISVSPPPGVFTFDWDNDYSINLLLANTEFGVSQEDAQKSDPFGQLIKAQDVITNPPVSLKTVGHFATDMHGTGLKTFGLHAEFEGAGNFNLMQVAEGMLGCTVVAYLLCLIAPFPIDLILALFMLFSSLVGIIVSKFVRPGSPSDVNPHLPTIHVNDEDNKGHGKGADVLFVQGTWVFDPLHEGWNELHPIKTCTKIGCWKGDWADIRCGDGPSLPAPPILLLRLQQAFQVAQSAETIANQKRPEHRWHFHPDLDGCAPDIIV
jgi:hypothetical protein